MIGKILYEVKVVDGSIKIFSYEIIEEKRKYYYFAQNPTRKHSCYKVDVGLVLFLTLREAMDYRIKQLEHLADMGEKYLKKTKQQLKDAKEISRERKK